MTKTFNLLIAMFLSVFVYGQDLIVKLVAKTSTVLGTETMIYSDTISFVDVNDGCRYIYPMSRIKEVHFNENQTNKIFTTSISLDTVYCRIKRITNKTVFYTQPDSDIVHEIETNKVFGVFFTDSNAIPALLEHQKLFLAYHRLREDDELFLTRNQSFNRKIFKPILLKDKIFWYSTSSSTSKTFLSDSVKNLLKLVNYNSADIVSHNTNNIHIKTNDGKHIKSIDLNFYANDAQNVSVITSSGKASLLQKKTINGVYFADFERYKKAPKDKDGAVIWHNYNLKFDINGGAGYRLAQAPKNSSQSDIDYINSLRIGTLVDANLTILLNEKLGLGLKLNRFATFNNKSEKISINYFGAGIYLYQNINNAKIFHHSLFLSGFSFYKDKGEATVYSYHGPEKQLVNITGKAFSVYLADGFDFSMGKNVYFGLQVGLTLGNISKFVVNGKKFKPAEKEGLIRFDSTIGLKFYF